MLTGSCQCGALTWRYDGMPDAATACSCTFCRRYGGLWIYDFEGGLISVSGPSVPYWRKDLAERYLSFNFCPTCHGLAFWKGDAPGEDGRVRMAVNIRLSEPQTVAHLPIAHFDGLDTWEDLPFDGRTVAHMWF